MLQLKTTERLRPRWWPVAVIAALAAASILWAWSSPELDTSFRIIRTILTVAVSLVLLLIWLLLLSRLRWRTRLGWLAVFILLGAGARLALRSDGSRDGSGLPKLTWKWTPKRDGNVGEPPTATTNAALARVETKLGSPAYLGANRLGVVENLRLDTNWTKHPPKQLWRHPVGLGWSSFAVSGSSAITQEQRGERELVVCYDLGTGVAKWSHTNLVRFSESMGGDGPRATPTIANGRVYALGGTGILDCLNFDTGKRIWTRDTLKENDLPNVMFGKSSSPLLFDDLVVVTGGWTNRGTLLAFHRGDGSPAWTGGTDRAAYSSPMLATLAGKRQILSLNATNLTAQDPADGSVYWKYDWGNGDWPNCTQPLALPGDKVLISSSFGLGCALLQVMAGPDGKPGVTEVWKTRSMKSKFSNMVVRGDNLYGLDDGILACVELSTGARRWKDGRYGYGQVLLAGDTLIVQAESGEIALVEANPNGFHELARMGGLGSKTWNMPALAGEYLLVRNDQEAACYKLPLKE